jgi:hypothetical protein
MPPGKLPVFAFATQGFLKACVGRGGDCQRRGVPDFHRNSSLYLLIDIVKMENYPQAPPLLIRSEIPRVCREGSSSLTVPGGVDGYKPPYPSRCIGTPSPISGVR